MKKLRNIFLMIAFSLVMSNCFTVNAESMASIREINYSSKNSDEHVEIILDRYKEPNIRRLKNPERIIVDFEETVVATKNRHIEVDSECIDSVRVGQFKPNVSRVVVDLKSYQEYSVDNKDGVCVLNIKSAGEENDEISNKELNKITLDYQTEDNCEKLKIKVDKYNNYKAFRLKNPDRIVVDIPGAFFDIPKNTFNCNGNWIKVIRYSNYTKTSARVILDVSKNPNYKIEENKDSLDIVITKNENYNSEEGKLNYIVAGDRVWIKLNKVGFTDRRGNNIGDYIEKYNFLKKTYTLIFDTELANLSDQVIMINDKYLDKIEVVNDIEKSKTKIVFWAKDNFVYNIISREKANDTAITILKKATREQNMVVIDAGHGGKEEPGSVCTLFYEKHVNLDIALRIEALLKKNNVKTYMIRENDSYVGEYERANIANKINARLFISIHNNSFSSEANGTETLYCPYDGNGTEDICSRKLAILVQKNLIEALGTRDRGIKERPNLIVLKCTDMPSILAEVAFLTNPEEQRLLDTNKFRQNAAEAISKAIIETLNSL